MLDFMSLFIIFLFHRSVHLHANPDQWDEAKMMIIFTQFLVIYCPQLQVTKAYNYIHKHGHKSKLMAAAIRNKQDIFSLMG